MLLALATLGDILEEVRDPFGFVSASFEQMYGFTPSQYKRHNFQVSVSHALKVKNIEKVVRNGEVCFRLTRRGKSRFFNDFPLVSLSKKSWDRKWRIIIFDIEEEKRKNRDVLRRKLYNLGFGKLQKSVYLSPFALEKEMEEFLEASGFSDKALLFVTDSVSLEKAKQLAREVWYLSSLNNQYFDLLEQVRNGKSSTERVRDLKSKLVDILLADPCLPSELLPTPWYRDEVVKEVKGMV